MCDSEHDRLTTERRAAERSKPRRLRLMLIAILAALALTAAACGGSDDSTDTADDGDASDQADTGGDAADDTDESEGTDTDDTGTDDEDDAGDTADDAGSTDDTESDTADSGDGADAAVEATGTLRVGVATNVQSFDPVMAAVAQEYYLHPVFDTLIHQEADSSFSPGLAESWEQVDPNTLQLTLRPDVRFSDGEALTADVIVANFERAKSIEASPSAAFYANIESVTALDDMSVEIALVRPSTSLLSDLSRLPGMMMSPLSFDASPDTAPVGAGGWTHDAGASNPGEVEVFQANPDYWDASQVQVATIEMRFFEADAANNAMLADQIDMIELRAQGDAQLFEGDDFQSITRPNTNVNYVQVMDTDGSLLEPLGDERVRQALSLAIDREAFNEGIQFGEGNPTPAFWIDGTPYYDPATEAMAYDPDRARELLAEAGYPDGFELSYPSFGGLVTAAEALQQMWADIGVTVTIDLVEPGTLANEMRSGNYAVTPTLARGFTAESHYLERLSPGGPYDPIGTDRGALPDLAAEALAATDVAGQDEAWKALYTEAVLQGYIMVIGHTIPTAVLGPDVMGAELSPSDNLPKPYGVSIG